MLDGYVISWNEEKNRILQKTRGICFEEVIFAEILDIIENPSKNHKDQLAFVVLLNDYVHIVPFVINKDKKEIFLKTIYPSRKFNKFYKNN